MLNFCFYVYSVLASCVPANSAVWDYGNRTLFVDSVPYYTLRGAQPVMVLDLQTLTTIVYQDPDRIFLGTYERFGGADVE